MQESYIYIRRAYKVLLENHKHNATANPECMGFSRVVRKQHSLICHYTAISRSHENGVCLNYSCMASACHDRT